MTALTEKCKPVRVLETSRHGSGPHATWIVCQHNHLYATIKDSEWAGSAWEAAVGKARAIGKPLYEVCDL